jgi:hypothetical protein
VNHIGRRSASPSPNDDQNNNGKGRDASDARRGYVPIGLVHHPPPDGPLCWLRPQRGEKPADLPVVCTKNLSSGVVVMKSA